MNIFKNGRLIVFALTMLLYLWFPFRLSGERERILENGTLYRFALHDMQAQDLAGSYVDLYYAVPSSLTASATFYPYQAAYLPLQTDSEGFASFSDPVAKPPQGDYLTIEITDIRDERLRYTLPGNMRRFYFDEPRATPEPEPLRPQRPQRQELAAYAEVKIWEGKAAVENLYIENQPVEEYLEAQTRNHSPKMPEDK